jgi:thiamine pyrophosphate-dependent acetolactate synthase large subunit-like protein
MNLREAITTIMPLLKGAHVVCATGFISREARAALDRPEQFYMIGSMGQASSIGLGAALAQPQRPIVVLDGDGSLLMNLGMVTMAGMLAPRNFYHLVLDNGVYASTGNQPTGLRAPLEAFAREAGSRQVVRVAEPEALRQRLAAMLREPGPAFLLVAIRTDEQAPAPRVPHEPEAMTERFRRTLAGAA